MTTARTASSPELVRVPPAVTTHSAQDSPRAAVIDVTSRPNTTLPAAGKETVHPPPVIALVRFVVSRKNRASQPGGGTFARTMKVSLAGPSLSRRMRNVAGPLVRADSRR